MQYKLRITLLALAVAVSTYAAASRDFWHELELGNDRFKDAVATSNPPAGSLFARIKQNIGGITNLTEATKMNARKSAKYLTDRSATIRNAVCSGQLQIKPAYYDMTSGKVTELAPLPRTLSFPCR